MQLICKDDVIYERQWQKAAHSLFFCGSNLQWCSLQATALHRTEGEFLILLWLCFASRNGMLYLQWLFSLASIFIDGNEPVSYIQLNVWLVWYILYFWGDNVKHFSTNMGCTWFFLKRIIGVTAGKPWKGVCAACHSTGAIFWVENKKATSWRPGFRKTAPLPLKWIYVCSLCMHAHMYV